MGMAKKSKFDLVSDAKSVVDKAQVIDNVQKKVSNHISEKEYHVLPVSIRPDLHRKLWIEKIKTERDIKEIIISAVNEYLENYSPDIDNGKTRMPTSGGKSLTMRVPISLFKKLQMFKVETGKTYNYVINKSVEEYFE